MPKEGKKGKVDKQKLEDCTPEEQESAKVFMAIQLDEKVAVSIISNKQKTEALSKIITLAGGKADKTQGNLLYKLATILPGTLEPYKKNFIDRIIGNKWNRILQLEEAIEWLKVEVKNHGDNLKFNNAEFD